MDEYRVHILEVDSLDRREIARHAGTGVAPFHTRISFTGSIHPDWGYLHPSSSPCSLGLVARISVPSRHAKLWLRRFRGLDIILRVLLVSD